MFIPFLEKIFYIKFTFTQTFLQIQERVQTLERQRINIQVKHIQAVLKQYYPIVLFYWPGHIFLLKPII